MVLSCSAIRSETTSENTSDVFASHGISARRPPILAGVLVEILVGKSLSIFSH